MDEWLQASLYLVWGVCVILKMNCVPAQCLPFFVNPLAKQVKQPRQIWEKATTKPQDPNQVVIAAGDFNKMDQDKNGDKAQHLCVEKGEIL